MSTVLAQAVDVPWAPLPNTVTTHLADAVPDPWAVALALVTRPGRNGMELLLVEVRARGFDTPGGHREAGETVRDTVLRELAEETGLVLGPEVPVRVIGYDHVHVTGARTPEYRYAYPSTHGAVTTIRVPAGTEPAGTTVPEEIAGHRWVPLAEVPAVCGPRLWLPYLDHLAA